MRAPVAGRAQSKHPVPPLTDNEPRQARAGGRVRERSHQPPSPPLAQVGPCSPLRPYCPFLSHGHGRRGVTHHCYSGGRGRSSHADYKPRCVRWVGRDGGRWAGRLVGLVALGTEARAAVWAAHTVPPPPRVKWVGMVCLSRRPAVVVEGSDPRPCGPPPDASARRRPSAVQNIPAAAH